MPKRQRPQQICPFCHDGMPYDNVPVDMAYNNDPVDMAYDDESDFKMLNDILDSENDIRQLKEILMKFDTVQEMEKLFKEAVDQILSDKNSN